MKFVVVNLNLTGSSKTYHIFTSKSSENMDLELDCILLQSQDNFM